MLYVTYCKQCLKYFSLCNLEDGELISVICLPIALKEKKIYYLKYWMCKYVDY